MDKKVTKAGDEIWEWICEQTDNHKERLELALDMIKNFDRQEKIDDLLNSDESVN